LADRLSEEERQRILLSCNEPEFAALPPGQIVPVLADRGLYIGSERSLYRLLHAHGQVHRRGRARQPQEPHPPHGSGLLVQTRFGAGTSPTCPPPCAGSGCTSTW
jgi:hypothetical protein